MWLLRFICEIFVLCCSQAADVKFRVLVYFAILRSVLNLLPLCSSHFRADSTVFNPDELHLHHITGFYVTSINCSWGTTERFTKAQVSCLIVLQF
jgi:hypothetical protein